MIDAVVKARETIESLPLDKLKASGFYLDRVKDNPEAARYFLAYGDWFPITSEEVFEAPERSSAEQTQVYVDFPFCPTVCTFCAFYPVIARHEDQMTAYIESLKKEIHLLRKTYFDQGFTADSLELGGGTPTYLPLHLLKDAVNTLLEQFPFAGDGERNFETTPEAITGTAGKAKLKFLRDAGFSRLSIGAQSFNDQLLKVSHRSHGSGHIVEALDNARELNFERINFDLLLGIADQKLEDFIEAVEKSIELGVEIIEIYTMRYFDTKKPVPLTRQYMEHPERFLEAHDLLAARIAADSMLRKEGYVSSNGRTYHKQDGSKGFYADYYEGNFKGANILGVGRKSHSNIYPWQYANYRNIEKYCSALENGTLPIAAGCKIDGRGRLAKLLTGAFQLMEPLNYENMKSPFHEEDVKPFDVLFDDLRDCDLITEVPGGYQKTFLGFLFTEEILKRVYDVSVTPFSVGTEFLGKKQATPALRPLPVVNPSTVA